MNKAQAITIASFVALLLILLFGFNTKPAKLLLQEKTRSLNQQFTDINIIKDQAMEQLSGDQRAQIQILQSKLDIADDSLKTNVALKELSGKWFAIENYALAGYYAEQIAEKSQNAAAWGIAGTTYAIGIKKSLEEKLQKYCREKSLLSLENAISLAPDNIEYQLNRSIVYIEHPEPDNPMKGVQLLLKLNKNFPENVPVINNLARFALQTNQLDKALVRLNTALELESDNKMTHCLLAQAYSNKGEEGLAEEFRIKCEQLN